VVLGSAAATEAIGVHPLFGPSSLAYLPSHPAFAKRSSNTSRNDRLRASAAVLFRFDGNADTVGSSQWDRNLVLDHRVLIVAIVGKMGGAVLAARWTGQSWKNALALGALLDTRGLVELIVLNIAYNAHVFSPTLFSMLVLMALITTMMTTPILNLLGIQNSDKQNQDRQLSRQPNEVRTGLRCGAPSQSMKKLPGDGLSGSYLSVRPTSTDKRVWSHRFAGQIR
jgi:Sodium/hydrogen exchanger family